MAEYILSDTPSGHKTLIYSDSKDVRLHSAYDPLSEAQRAVGAFRRGRARHILVCGLALGYHVGVLRERFPDCAIIVIERDPRVARIAQETCPGLLEGIRLIVSPGDLTPVMESLDITGFRGMAVYYHRPSYGLHRGFYDEMVGDINRYLSSRLSDLLTRFEFEERWIGNIFQNIPKTFTAGRVLSLFGRFAGCPGIIVSAGPSLRKNMHLLPRLRDRALIVAVDTALKALVRKGIEPHIVMTLDAQKHSIRHFLGVRPAESLLLADVVSAPRISDRYEGGIMFSTTSKFYTDGSGRLRREPTPLMDWLEPYIEPPGDIQSGGSVATSAFDLLLNLGCRPIILVGQDLAYTGREIHCAGTHHNDDWLPTTNRFTNLDTINQRVIRRRKIKYIPRYGGEGEVISDYVFDLYRSWFEDSAGKVGFPVINATGGGARIRNTREKSLEELSLEMNTPARSPGEILAEACAGTASSPKRFREALVMGLKSVSELIRLAGDRESGRPPSERIFQLINDEELSKLYAVFLRKTSAYMARHPDIDPEKAATMLAGDIAAASQKLRRMMEDCLARIDALSGDGH